MTQAKLEFPKNLEIKLVCKVPMPETKTITLINNKDGKLESCVVSVEDLPRLIGQKFLWTDSILIEDSLNQKLATYSTNNDVLPNTLQQYFDSIKSVAANLAIKFINEVVGYGVATLAPIKKGQPIGFYTGLYDVNYGPVDVIEIKEEEDITSLSDKFKLTSMNLLVLKGNDILCIYRPTKKLITLHLDNEQLSRLKEVIGPCSTLKSIDRNKFRTLDFISPILADDYMLGSYTSATTGRDFRNYASFITHAMQPVSEKPPCLENFEPVNSDIEPVEWRSSLLHENISLKYLKYKGLNLAMFIAEEDIPPDGILAWDYGVYYWLSRSRQELMNKKGDIIESSDYRYTARNLFGFFNQNQELPSKPAQEAQKLEI